MSDDSADENLEWELSDLVDAIAAEVDSAQDTLSLKSYSRGLSLSLKKLSLTVEVKARRTGDGKLLFRTVNPDETSATVLKLEFDQVLQSQLMEVRKSFEGAAIADETAIAAATVDDPFADLSDQERRSLEILGIRSIDDLNRYPKSPQIIAEISRKTGIEASQIHRWFSK